MPAKQYTAKQLKAIYDKKTAFIDKSLTLFDDDIKRLQNELFDVLITEYISQFTITDGVIVMNERNLRILSELDKVMSDFKSNFALDPFKTLGENMLKMTDLTSDYFRAMTGKKTIMNIADKLDKYRAAVGLNKKGEIIKGSFLDNLASTPELKTKLSQYMQTAVTSEQDYKAFSKGLKDLVKGSKGVNGAMERYVGQYAGEAFFEQARLQDSFFADQLELDYFLWEGERIETSRPLCIHNHGKVFSREQIESLNSKEWQGKIPGVDVFAQVGGYRCRHILRAITSDMAESIGIAAFNNEDFE